MKRSTYSSVVALAVASFLAVSAPAGASTKWICEVPDVGQVTFVTAADAARHGIETANSRAGTTFSLRFGESCFVA
jgi:hypothetical protein